MNEAVYVARNLNAPGLIVFYAGYGTLVGANPLDSIDGDGSYAECDNGEAVTFDLFHASGPRPPTEPVAGMTLTWDFSWRMLSTAGSPPGLEVSAAPPNFTGYSPMFVAGAPSDDYTTLLDQGTVITDDDTVQPITPDPYFLGDYWALRDLLTFNTLHMQLGAFRSAVRFSYFVARVRWPGGMPLQWRQRTDELGVSGVRPARHASTFQATNRARGML